MKKEIEYIGGYYPYETLSEVIENVVASLTRQCMINGHLVTLLLKTYGIDSEYQTIIVETVTTHLRKVSSYILDNIDDRVVYARTGFLPNEVIFEITKK